MKLWKVYFDNGYSENWIELMVGENKSDLKKKAEEKKSNLFGNNKYGYFHILEEVKDIDGYKIKLEKY
jgi:hypothetical protein